MSTLTKTQKYILEAIRRGYRVEDGVIIGIRGPRKISTYGKQRYPTFSITVNNKPFGIPAHLFAAYIYYGEDTFKQGIVVRHLNGDTLDISKENIKLGSHSDNNLDKPEAVRISSAKKARASQGIIPTNAKLTKEDVLSIRDVYKSIGDKKAPNGFLKDLSDKYGVSRTVIRKVVNREYYGSYLD